MDTALSGQFVFYLVFFLATIIALIFSSVYTMMKSQKNEGDGKTRKQSSEKSDTAEPEGETEKLLKQHSPDHKGDGDSGSKSKSDRWKEVDPVEYCEHIPSHVKKIQQKTTVKKIQENLSEEQLEDERDIQRKQLEAIFNLMNGDDKFGVNSLDDVQSQMKLYA